MQVISVSVSNGNVNSLSTFKIKKHLATLAYLRFCCWLLSCTLKRFKIIYCRI